MVKKEYRVYGYSSRSWSCFVEAENEEEAKRIAKNSDKWECDEEEGERIKVADAEVVE